MTINIGGETLSLTVPPEEKNMVREAEREVQHLYNDWIRRFPKCTPRQVLAMVAYQFSYFFQELKIKQFKANDELSVCNEKLNGLIDRAQEALKI